MTPIRPKIKPHYRSGIDDLATDFFSPCLQAATSYRRAVGYFSSRALLTWVEALPRMISANNLNIKLIASPEMSREDINVLNKLSNEEERTKYRQLVVDRLLEEVITLADDPTSQDARARIFAWLIANDRLQIRFAFAKHLERPGIYHEKMGVFAFSDDALVAFTGSANETLGGHKLNYESLDVYRSWVPGDKERVDIKVKQFDEAWTNKATALDVKLPNKKTLALLKSRAYKSPPTPLEPMSTSPEHEPSKWRHQEEAVDAYIGKRTGVLEMATGTGKTRTALKILDRLIENGSISAAIITTDGTDLLDQWCEELGNWLHATGRRWPIYRHFERHKGLVDFALDPYQAIVVVSRGQLHKLLGRISPDQKRHMIIVHDEVHGLGAPGQIASLQTQHRSFDWRLGLSATPERTYDDIGNAFIENEIGPIVYRFPLESAIQRGVLSELDYVPLQYELTKTDRKRLRDVYAKRAARARVGNPMSNEEVWTELSRVYKTAEMKPQVFSTYLAANPGILKNCIIFVETREYGNRLLEDIHRYTTRYRTYYAEDDRDHLVQFSRSQIDCLVTCHRISQGIDIHSLRTVVLFASARSKLETIQRVGRCLRIDPSAPAKRAFVVDFVRSEALRKPAESATGALQQIPNADVERCKWLTDIANIRRAQ